MNKSHTLKSICLTSLLYLSSAQAVEPNSHGNAVDLLKIGQENAQFCRHCHGVGGVSVNSDVPNLAGQNAAYLLDQMNKFAAGQRKSEFMEGLIKALKPEERASIALYFSRQTVVPQPIKNSDQAEEGKKLYAKLCMYCHGANGYGSESIPRLAGQQNTYLQLSLKRYRSGSGERIDSRMQAYTRNLKDQDIVNLAAYLASLR